MTIEEMEKRLALMKTLRGYLMDGKKMSQEDAEKKLSEASEDDVQQLVGESEEYAKHLAEKEAEEKEKQEASQARMTALIEGTAKLTSGLKTSLASVRLAQRKCDIGVRLSSLRAAGKLTPAEQKKINIEDMAKLDETALSAAMKSYEDREPVIMIGMYGTVKGENVAKLQKSFEKKQLEKETRARFTSLGKKAMTKLSEGEKSEEKKEGSEEHLAGSENLGTLEIIHHMMEEGKWDEAKAKLKEFMGACNTQMGDSSVADEKAKEELAALAKGVDSLQTQLSTVESEFEKLLGEFQGGTK